MVKLYLRCDVSESIGLGHLNRLRGFASFCRDPIFLINNDGVEIAKSILSPKARIIGIDTQDFNWIDEIEKSAKIICDLFYFNNKFKAEAEVIKFCNSDKDVIVIDGLPPHDFDASANVFKNKIPKYVITPYLFSKNIKTKPTCKIWLTGPQYLTFDPNYDSLRYTAIKEIKRIIDVKILICCGGSDSSGLSLKILDNLLSFQGKIVVVVGPMFLSEHVTKLQDLASTNKHIMLVHKPNSLSNLIHDCALVVGRPGLIRYESAYFRKHAVFLTHNLDYMKYFNNFNSLGISEVHYSEHSFFRRLREISSLDFKAKIFQPNDKHHIIFDKKLIQNLIKHM